MVAFATGLLLQAFAQQRPEDALNIAREQLLQQGFSNDDLQDLVVKDSYVSSDNGLRHTYIRQRWQCIEIWNGDIAVHLAPDGRIAKLNIGAFPHLAKHVHTTTPLLSAQSALAIVLAKTAPGVALPMLLASEDAGRHLTFDGDALGEVPVKVQLMYQPMNDRLVLVWNVNHYLPDGSHWWNVRIDAITGQEVDRNDWVSQCSFDHPADSRVLPVASSDCPLAAPPPAAPNDYNVYPAPVESPNHGARALRNAPWTLGGIASPYGWHDTNGATGPEYTYTRGNNVWAQEDANANNGIGYSPTSATLDFDYAINFAQAPVNYRDAAITNLYYWNNLMHDVWYQYGFNEVGGNFQQNNYGRGGIGADYALADAEDGGGTNNANFATPPDGSAPRMQMYLWTYNTPNRDGDLDNGVVAHEYTHGISNRLVGGPSNTSCLANAEQMGEGWSDWFALMMTIEPGDQGPDRRGIGTYVINQPTSGIGIRPAPYSTDFSQNNYTYAATNNTALAAPHGIGFVWCTMLWDMTWNLINAYGFDPNLYTGTGGNNIAMRLVVDGMKLTPCNPGFVDARDAILAADAADYGGAHTNLIWAAFAGRGLGVSANQGSSGSRTDQTEAYDTPLANNVGVASITTPASSQLLNCTSAPITVTAVIRNYGQSAQSNFPVRYQLDGGALVSQLFSGTLNSGAQSVFTFTQTVTISGIGAHTLAISTALAGDLFAGNDQVSMAINVVAGTPLAVPFTEGLSTVSPTPTGWSIQNMDGGITWGTTVLTNGPTCASSRAWSIDHYTDANVGQEDRLLTPKIDLTTAIGSLLKFDHAYAPYGAGYYDSFRVDVSTNCGANWTQLYFASGVALGTATATTAAWVPTACSQWQAHIIPLSAYDGQVIMLRFVAINAYGNWFYMDNVQVLKSATLPVELLTFTARPETDGILLHWTTATERNTDRFIIERSVDAQNWSAIGTQPAGGNSLVAIGYAFLDQAPVQGMNYYRLRMQDLDGYFDYSWTATAEWKDAGQLCFPNPNDGTFRVRTSTNTPIEVIDALGRIVPYTAIIQNDGTMRIDLGRSMPGLFLVRIGTGDAARIERVVLDR